MTKNYIELMCFNIKTIYVILQCHIRKKIYIASYNNMSNSDNANYNTNTNNNNNTNINKLVNCDLFNII